jgi:hypothetical protein
MDSVLQRPAVDPGDIGGIELRRVAVVRVRRKLTQAAFAEERTPAAAAHAAIGEQEFEQGIAYVHNESG